MATITVIPAGQDGVVHAGDFILVHRRGIVSWLIRVGERLRLRRGQWSHAAFAESSNTLIEALDKGVVRTPLSAYHDVEYAVVNVANSLGWTDIDQAVAFARSCVGQEYGWWMIVGTALRFLTPGRGLWLGMDGTEICSGLVAQAMVRGWSNFPVNPASMTPQELADYYSNPTNS